MLNATPIRQVPIIVSLASAGIIFLGTASVLEARTATDAVKETIGEVVQIISDEELKQPGRLSERRQRLEHAVGKRFVYKEMAKHCLGSYWGNLSAAEQTEFVEVFARFLLKLYAGKLEAYSGHQIQYLDQHEAGPYAEVRTKVIGTEAEIPVTYRLVRVSGDWQVYNVVIDGVNLASNYAAQFKRILRQSSYGTLLGRLRTISEGA